MTDHIEAKIAVVLGELSRALCDYLARVLPRLQPADWWGRLVVGKLSHQQAERQRQTRGGDLGGLDLAALLRVFDANWWEICNRESLPSECRHYLKEMQSVRNRWAHATAALPSPDTIFRDLDTVQRLLIAVAPDHPAVSALDDLKRQALQAPSPVADSAPPPPVAQAEAPPPPTPPAFAPGSLVCLKSDPGKTGVVVTTESGHPEDRVIVFIDGGKRPFYASQIQPDGEPADAEIAVAAAERFHACLTATHLAHPCGATLFSLNAARIDFIPYQFRPVIKFIRADLPRLLIADSVGVGKTIEAGLILRELQARRPLANVLIVCPRPLVAEEKWKTEMRRFDERFVHLDGPTLRHCIEEMHLEGTWDPRYSRVIVPYSLFDEKLLKGEKGRRKRKGLCDLNPPPHFDLVIVDEAHHIRNPNTYAHKAVRFFCDNAEAVLFMTATPLQTGDNDLFVLLNALRPDWVIDQASYAEMAAPNPHINRAATAARGGAVDWRTEALAELDAAVATSWGKATYPADPAYVKARRLLEAADCDSRGRIEAISAIESLHTFAGLINRTRRRDIGDFAVRKPETVAVDFTPAQRQIHDGLLAMHRLLLTRCHDVQCVDFMMTTLKRQAASCIFGLAPMLGDILGRRLDELRILAEDGLSSLDETLHNALREGAAALV
ncbi:MAG: Swt1 family HEPN domain-containing protein [Lentisphaeria bacterium]|nr:Swt1 family HEPN domain-containing protein [Lentisphaeria bacterium]